MEDKGSRVLILAGSSLQYWSFPHNEQEKMEFDEDIGHIILQTFQRKILVCMICHLYLRTFYLTISIILGVQDM